MRDVALAAGVNKALVFYYFNSKAELFERVLERYYVAHREALAAAFSKDAPLKDRLHGMIDAYLDFIEAHRRYPSLVQQQVARGEGGHLGLIRKNLEPLFRWITGALGEIAPAEGPLAARHFTYAPVLQGLWGEDPLSAAALAERRAHVHWMVDGILERMAAEASPP